MATLPTTLYYLDQNGDPVEVSTATPLPTTGGGGGGGGGGDMYKADNLSGLANYATARSNLGLGNVDNTSDANKPVSTAQQTALDLKASAATVSSHIANTSNPHSVTAAQVGLGNVDNTSDDNKPVSTATQTALNLKANIASPTFTGTPAAPTATAGTNTTQLATTAFVTAAVAAGGGSSGTKTYGRFTPQDNQPPATNYATFGTRNAIAVLEFNDTTQQSAVFVGIIPEGASLGSGLIFRIHCMSATATSGDYVLGVQMERMNTDEDSDSFDTAAEVTTTTNATSGIISRTDVTLTTIDGAVAGDPVRIKIYRKAADAADTMTGNLQLVVAEMRSAA